MGHIIAHSKGGGCTNDNLYWICKKCNIFVKNHTDNKALNIIQGFFISKYK